MDGLHTRADDGPTTTTYYENGMKLADEWYSVNRHYGRSREDDLPAAITYYPTGQVKYEEWFLYGKKFRENGKPTLIKYDTNGKVLYEM